MKRTTSLNLTSGPILKTLSELALPIMASSMLATAYNITDMAWIGMLGAKAVAGVGVGGMYVWLSQGLASLPRMGGQVHAAQACGRGDYEKARSYASSAIQLSLFFGLLFSAACVLFIDPLLGFFQLDDANTYAAARSYMLITCGLLVFSYLNLTLTGLSTAQGDSKTPLMANLLGLISNMILDPMLILGIVDRFPVLRRSVPRSQLSPHRSLYSSCSSSNPYAQRNQIFCGASGSLPGFRQTIIRIFSGSAFRPLSRAHFTASSPWC